MPQFTFASIDNYLQVDEKWFYIMPLSRTVLLLPGEKPPKMKATSKRHLIKVMLLAAATNPRYDDLRQELFDGKVGLWPFVEKVHTQRASRNRPKGTLETKPIWYRQQ